MVIKKNNRICVALAEKNLNNKWFAEKFGRNQSTISKWVTIRKEEILSK
jgi:hypothetical protein